MYCSNFLLHTKLDERIYQLMKISLESILRWPLSLYLWSNINSDLKLYKVRENIMSNNVFASFFINNWFIMIYIVECTNVLQSDKKVMFTATMLHLVPKIYLDYHWSYLTVSLALCQCLWLFVSIHSKSGIMN